MMSASPHEKMLAAVELNRARAFIAGNAWIFAKTYAKTAPHEYVVKDRLPSEAVKREFEWMVVLVREHGYEAEFWGKVHIYLNIDGKRCKREWMMK